MSSFYGEDQAMIHHREFGDLAATAAGLVVAELRQTGLVEGTVVDLGCGSGILARAMLEAGYRVFGVDLSADMVDLARAEAPAAQIVQGSVHDVALPQAVAVTAIGEVLNYATDVRAGLDALAHLARRVRTVLEPGGLFVFDVSTPGRYGPGGRRVVFHDREDWSLAMQAEEDREESTLHRRIVVFRRTTQPGSEGGSGAGEYRRTDEHHVLRLYDPGAVSAVLEEAGFVGVERRNGYGSVTRSTPAEGWAVFVAHA